MNQNNDGAAGRGDQRGGSEDCSLGRNRSDPTTLTDVVSELSLSPDLIERNIYAGARHVGSVVSQARTNSWASFDANGLAIGAFEDERKAGAAVLAHCAARLNAGGAA